MAAKRFLVEEGHIMMFARAIGDENPVYYVLGQTSAGRYLLCVVIAFPDGNGYPVTARPMTDKERRRFRQWKKR